MAKSKAVKKEENEEEKKAYYEENQEKNQDEVEEKADEGEMLVLRGDLRGFQRDEDEQRKNIFYSRCTIQDKVCSLIIDGGGCANAVSFSMIEKLGL